MAHVLIQPLLQALLRLSGRPMGIDFGKGNALKNKTPRGPFP
jgi:hypothetical protein